MTMAQYSDLKIRCSSQYVDLKSRYAFSFRSVHLWLMLPNEVKRGHMLPGCSHLALE